MRSNPEYSAKISIAQMNPIAYAATCPTMVIPLVLIRDWMTSLDKPFEKGRQKYSNKFSMKVLLDRLKIKKNIEK